MSRIACITCPNCGAPIAGSSTGCGFCASSIVVTGLHALRGATPEVLRKYALVYESPGLEVNESDRLTAKAIVLIRMKMFEKARELLERVIESDPLYGPAYLYLVVASIGRHEVRAIKLQEARRLCSILIECRNLSSLQEECDFLLETLRRDYFVRNGISFPLKNWARSEIVAVSPELQAITDLLNMKLSSAA